MEEQDTQNQKELQEIEDRIEKLILNYYDD